MNVEKRQRIERRIAECRAHHAYRSSYGKPSEDKGDA